MECESCCICGKPQGVICWCNEYNRKALCKGCLGTHLNEPGAHIILAGKLKANQMQKIWENMKNFEEFREFVRKRINRLRYLKEKVVLEIQLAGEELKRLVDKEIAKIIKEILDDCLVCEGNMRVVLDEINGEKGKSVRIGNKELISAEPLEFQVVSEPIFDALNGMFKYRLNGLEEGDQKLPFFTDEFQELSVFTPRTNQLRIVTKQKLRIVRNSAVCSVPKDWIYIAGGETATSSSSLCQRFRITRSKVFDMQPLNTPRHSFSMIYNNNTLYAFGGKNEGKILNSSEKFSIQTREWINLPNMTEGKFDLSLVKMNEFIYICGSGSNKIEKFDMVNEKFIVLIEKSEGLRLLPSIDDNLILLYAGHIEYIDSENGQVQEKINFDGAAWKGTSNPVIFENCVFFDVNGQIWRFNLLSNRLCENQN